MNKVISDTAEYGCRILGWYQSSSFGWHAPWYNLLHTKAICTPRPVYLSWRTGGTGVINRRLFFLRGEMSRPRVWIEKTWEAKDFMAKVDTSVIGTKYNKGCFGRFWSCFVSCSVFSWPALQHVRNGEEINRLQPKALPQVTTELTTRPS